MISHWLLASQSQSKGGIPFFRHQMTGDFPFEFHSVFDTVGWTSKGKGKGRILL